MLKNTKKLNKADREKAFNDVYQLARITGLQSGEYFEPTPMIVVDDIGQEYIIEEGLCGFAWINIKPGNSQFANWLKANDHATKDSYYGGVTVWVSEFNQSMERKIKYARAFAKVLSDNGLERVYVGSRMD